MTAEVQPIETCELTESELEGVTGGLLPRGFFTPAILIGMCDTGGTLSGTATASGTKAGGTAKVGS